MTTVTPAPANLGDRLPDGPAVVKFEATLPVEVSPLTAYRSLSGGEPYAFLLESAEKVDSSDPDGAFRPSGARPDRHARFSFVGYEPVTVIRVNPSETTVEVLEEDPLGEYIGQTGSGITDRLRRAMPDLPTVGFAEGDRQLLEGGLVGYLSYDAVYDLWLEEVGVDGQATELPDAEFVLATKVLCFDELAGTVSLVVTPLVTPGDDLVSLHESVEAEAERLKDVLGDAEPTPLGGFTMADKRSGARDEYEDAVRRAKEHVLDGDIYQGVISRERILEGSVDPHGFYAALRDVNPSPYMYLLEFGERTIVGASPETLVSVHGDRIVSNPIAGTCPRGNSPVEDRRLAGEMLADDKERAEHTMLVDLARNDVRRVAEPGSVRVEEFMNVLKYSHVQHIESTVTGRLAADRDAFDATRATFPAGTLAGAPKIRAMELIDELEPTPRGIYGGGVGYFSWAGDADFAIVIRSATIRHDGETDEITVRAGAGIVADSDPAAEFDETEAKMDGVLAALERIEGTSDTTWAEVPR